MEMMAFDTGHAGKNSTVIDNPEKPAAPAPGDTPVATHGASAHGAQASPGLSLRDFRLLIVDPHSGMVIWQSSSGFDFDGTARLRHAPIRQAIRHLSQGDQRQFLELVREVSLTGVAGPRQFGAAGSSVPVLARARRYQSQKSRSFIIIANDLMPAIETSGDIVRGLAPLIKYFVDIVDKAVAVIDNFGYLRFANDLFYEMLGVADPSRLIGRHIHHVEHHVGRTFVRLLGPALEKKRASNGTRRFYCGDRPPAQLSYSLVPFRVSQGMGGMLFVADRKEAEEAIDYEHLFEILPRPSLLVSSTSRIVERANQAARAMFFIPEGNLRNIVLTDTMLHSNSWQQLLRLARANDLGYVRQTISGFDGRSRQYEVRAWFVGKSRNSSLVLECRR